jgi:hypothetical protein
MFLLSIPCFSSDFGEIKFKDGSFMYNGITYTDSLYVSFSGCITEIEAEKVLELKIVNDSLVGKVIFIKTKNQMIEFPIKNIKCIYQKDKSIGIDLF